MIYWLIGLDCFPFRPLTDPQGVVHLNVYHRNLLGIDEFLGHLDIPLEDFNIYDRPRSRYGI